MEKRVPLKKKIQSRLFVNIVRCLVKKKALIAGGGAPEIEVAQQLSILSKVTKKLFTVYNRFQNPLQLQKYR